MNSKLRVVEKILVNESSVGSDMTVMLNLEMSLSGRLEGSGRVHSQSF